MVVAGASIAAGVGIALAFTRMTSLALPVVSTFTVEVVDQIHTVATIFARVVMTLVDVEVTQMALPAIATDALVGAHAVDASAAILTGVDCAVIHILMAVGAAEARVTGACEVADG